MNFNLRTVSWIAFFCFMSALYGHWVSEQAHKQAIAQQKDTYVSSVKGTSQEFTGAGDISDINTSSETAAANMAEPKGKNINVETDVLNVSINTEGGDILYAQLKKYPAELGGNEGVVVFSNEPDSYRVAQSGLLSSHGPDTATKRAIFKSEKTSFDMGEAKTLSVVLNHTTDSGVKIAKIYTFYRGRYDVDISYAVNNQSAKVFEGRAFGRIKWVKPEPVSRGMGVSSYTGGMIKTTKSQDSYQKVDYSTFGSNQDRMTMLGGWVAFVDQYFLGAWIPAKGSENLLSSELLDAKVGGEQVYSLRFVNEPLVVAPNATATIKNTLYVGPEVVSSLDALSPGLRKTVDYGIFWPIAWPIFLLLKLVYSFVGNWGLAIIGTTLAIKIIFYLPSASSYKSMAKMKKLQPKMEQIKERFGDDKEAQGKAIMELYKKEKLNPLGGCLPMLIQIPVFIALYWVLIESVELRQAPFFGWVQDLSSKDPYYILPLLMGASMLVQQKLSPAPPDPVQAKTMMLLPVVFTFMFLSFPSGLVLYWLTNNILSIAQQYLITKTIENEDEPKGRKIKLGAGA